MKYDSCKRCGRYVFDDECRCVRFDVGIPWRGQVDDWDHIYAREAEYAAEMYAELHDANGDYTIIQSGEAEIWVRDSEGVITKWDITAESVPTYSATQRDAVTESSSLPEGLKQ